MAWRDYIKTTQDLIKVSYHPKGGWNLLKNLTGDILKDAPVITTTTGVNNPVYGAVAFAQLNQEFNIFSAMDKRAWLKSGWRAITARAAASGGGVAENAALPATIKPTFQEVSTKPKEIVHNFDISTKQDILSQVDDNFGSMDAMRQIMAVHHNEMMNVMLGTEFGTLASNDLESVDRITASSVERAACGEDDGDEDLYTTIDRSAATAFNATVNHNSNTDRVFSDELVRDTLNDQRAAGGEATFILTGHDTYTAIQSEYSGAVHYNPLGLGKVSVGVNGVQTAEGSPVGLDIPTLYGKPLIVSKNVAADTISRMYFLDTRDQFGLGEPGVYIKLAVPTQYFESSDFFGINKLGKEGMYYTAAELIGTRLNAQAKLRDLK